MSNKYSSVISHCMQSQVTDTFIHQSMYQWLDGTCILQIYHECNTRFRVFFFIISWSIVNHCKYSVNIKIQLSIYDHKGHFCYSAGPASSLFEKSYYELMKNALRPGGIVCCQGMASSNYQMIKQIIKNHQ